MIKVYKPQSEILKKYIVVFTSLDEPVTDSLNYFVFPQLGTTLALFKNTHFETRNNAAFFSPTKEENHVTILTGKYTLPVQLNLRKGTDDLAINFKANAVNAFFDEAFGEFAQENFQVVKDEQWEKLCQEVMQVTDFIDRCKLLEEKLEQMICNKPNEQIEKALHLLGEEEVLSVKEIAQRVGWSERSLNRNFQKFIGCSLREHKRIMRFRKVLETKFKEDPSLSLTEVCFDSGYFDSPHLAKEFKKLTGVSPRAFFREVQAVGSEKFPYRLE